MRVEAGESFTVAWWANYSSFDYPKTVAAFRSGNGCYFGQDRAGATAGFEFGHGFNARAIDACYRDHHTLAGPTVHGRVPLDVDLTTLIGRWTHFALVTDRDPAAAGGPHLAIYVDGVRQSSTLNISAVVGPLWGQNGNANAGGLVIGTLYGWQTAGALDEFRFYKRALSSREVGAVYTYRPPPYVCPRPSINVLAYYPFDGNANDMTTNGRNGVVTGTVSWGRGATPLSSASLQITACSACGAHQYVTLPQSAWLGRRPTWTFAAWVTCTSCSWVYAEHGNVASNTHHNTLHTSMGGFFDQYPPSGTNPGVLTGNVPAAALDDLATTWHHFAWVKPASDADLLLYVDGVLASTEAWEAPTGVAAAGSTVTAIPGHRARSDATYFAGSIDEVFLSPDALSAETIAFLAGGGIPNIVAA